MNSLSYSWKKWSFHTLLFATLLFASWQTNFPQARGFPNDRFASRLYHLSECDGPSTVLVKVSVEAKLNGTSPTSFMISEGKPYYSQFGLQKDLISMLGRFISTKNLFSTAEALIRILSALVLAGFTGWASTRFGIITGLLPTLYLSLADWPIFFAGHLYWMLFLFWLPFVLPWLILQKMGRTQSGFLLILGMHLVLTWLRCLCGYEFVTCLILAPLPALAFFWLAPGHRPIWRKALGMMILVGLAGTSGFAGAVGSHVLKGVWGDGMTIPGIVAKIQERASARTSFQPDGGGAAADMALKKVSTVYQKIDRMGLAGSMAGTLFMATYRYVGYFVADTITVPFSHGMPFGVFLLIFLGCLLAHWRARKRLSPDLARLLAATLAAALVSFSWWGIAFNHMMQHVHNNSITLYLAFVPVALVYMTRLAMELPGHTRD